MEVLFFGIHLKTNMEQYSENGFKKGRLLYEDAL